MRCRHAENLAVPANVKVRKDVHSGKPTPTKKYKDGRCYKTWSKLGQPRRHLHPPDDLEPYRLRVRLYVHVGFVQWLLARDEWDDAQMRKLKKDKLNKENSGGKNEKRIGLPEYPVVFPSVRCQARVAVARFFEENATRGGEVGLREELMTAAESYARTYTLQPDKKTVRKCIIIVEKMDLARALLKRMKKNPKLTVRDALGDEMEHRDPKVNASYRPMVVPRPVLRNRKVVYEQDPAALLPKKKVGQVGKASEEFVKPMKRKLYC